MTNIQAREAFEFSALTLFLLILIAMWGGGPLAFEHRIMAKRKTVQSESWLAAHSDLAGVFADNESSSAGAVQALKSRGAKQVKLVAFDASDQLIAELRDGAIDSIVVQNPFRMGYESARAIGLKLSGQTPQRKLDSGAALIRREDLEREETRQLLFPDIQKYLKQAN